jgi:hypothetical protein
MGVLSWFTKAPEKAIDIVGDVTGGVMSGIDAVWETEEEKKLYSKEIFELKIKAAEKISDTSLKMAELSANENTAKSFTCRMIAVAFVAVYLVLYVAGAIVYQWDKAHSEFLFKAAGGMHVVITPIVIFYFGYYAVANVLKSKKG